MTQRLNRKGFSTVEILITILIVVALTTAGIFVWQRNKDDQDKNTDTTASQDKHKNQTPTPTDPTEDGKYLVIEEWGVRVELPEELRGDIYYRWDRNDNLRAEIISFASNKVDQLAGDERCTFKNNPQNNGLSARILRGSKSNLEGSSRELIAEFQGTTYYMPVTGDSPITCATAVGGNDIIPGLYETEREISKKLGDAFKTLQPIN